MGLVPAGGCGMDTVRRVVERLLRRKGGFKAEFSVRVKRDPMVVWARSGSALRVLWIEPFLLSKPS